MTDCIEEELQALRDLAESRARVSVEGDELSAPFEGEVWTSDEIEAPLSPKEWSALRKPLSPKEWSALRKADNVVLACRHHPDKPTRAQYAWQAGCSTRECFQELCHPPASEYGITDEAARATLIGLAEKAAERAAERGTTTIAQRVAIVDRLHLQELEMTRGKGDAYNVEGDALSNFRRAAESAGLSKYQAWLVYFMKHVDTILLAIKKNPSAPHDPTEGLGGRIVDARTYLGILQAMLEEDAR